MKLLAGFLALLVAPSIWANEMFLAPIESVVFSGTDIYGEGKYSITISLNRTDETVQVTDIEVTIHGETSHVDTKILTEVTNPDLGSIQIINDIGIFGSYFYFHIPFGDVGKCRSARREKQRMILSLHSGEDSRLESVNITDPCE